MAPAWSSRGSCDPTPCRAHQPPWPTSWDCATWPSRSTTCRRLSIGQPPRATDWSVASASTRAPGGWPTSAGRKGSSSRWPSASAEPRNARLCRRALPLTTPPCGCGRDGRASGPALAHPLLAPSPVNLAPSSDAVRSVPTLRVFVSEPARRVRDHAERQPRRVAHDPPAVHLPNTGSAQCFEPGDLRVEVVGVDVDVDPAGSRCDPLHEQGELLPGQLGPMEFGEALGAAGLPAGRVLPEGELSVVDRLGRVYNDLVDPAVVRHRPTSTSHPPQDQDGESTARGPTAGNGRAPSREYAFAGPE